MRVANLRLSLLTALALTLAGPAAAASLQDIRLTASELGPFAIAVRDETWEDTRRDRAIPVRIYAPARDRPAPVVIFSHGLGGSREAAPYLGTHWASHGYLAIFIQHPGSDRAVWEGKTGAEARRALIAAATPAAAFARFRDIPFVLDEIDRRQKTGVVNADTNRIAIAGHSFGSHTVLAAAGRVYPTPMGPISFKDKRIRAGIALSPAPPPQNVSDSALRAIYAPIDIPMLHITGTADGDPLRGATDPAQRLVPFRKIEGPPQILVVFDGADHMVFSGRTGELWTDVQPWYPDVQKDVQTLSTLFLKAHLEDDAAAKTALSKSWSEMGMRHKGRLERKGPMASEGR